MELDVGRAVVALQRLTVKQLRQRYAEVFDELRGSLPEEEPTEELSSLPRLQDFLASARESQFFTMVIVPQRSRKQLIDDGLMYLRLPT